MNSELENYLTVALKRLEKAYKEVIKTQGYNAEAEKIKILTEIVREQGANENSSNPAR
jgi:hypothetical protein